MYSVATLWAKMAFENTANPLPANNADLPNKLFSNGLSWLPGLRFPGALSQLLLLFQFRAGNDSLQPNLLTRLDINF
jgi:hypothetical protein